MLKLIEGDPRRRLSALSENEANHSRIKAKTGEVKYPACAGCDILRRRRKVILLLRSSDILFASNCAKRNNTRRQPNITATQLNSPKANRVAKGTCECKCLLLTVAVNLDAFP